MAMCTVQDLVRLVCHKFEASRAVKLMQHVAANLNMKGLLFLYTPPVCKEMLSYLINMHQHGRSI